MNEFDIALIIGLAVGVEQIVRQLKDLVLKPLHDRYPVLVNDTVYLWIVRGVAFTLGFGGAWLADMDIFAMNGYAVIEPVGAVAIGAIVMAGEAGAHRIIDVLNMLLALRVQTIKGKIESADGAVG